MARTAFCRANKGDPVGPNELLQGNNSKERYMLLQVHNPTEYEAYVTLTDDRSQAITSFMVAAGSTQVVNGLPESTYAVAYVMGKEFSRGCSSFIQLKYTRSLTGKIVFTKFNPEWRVSLISTDDIVY